ncbi:hypothetical protein N7462_011293 [Penicillium macrosclerotiorum]|uniref:uncharacterized protein n=1 Tax=Penicillium macrosclerotiorum TaxID=303699 RepID=UPI002546E804|nr:uncharacterized protein N7462_011293 [Penicillium macrosclerotiorum]KAJ5666884.1 hypothetical protein N7462_011293 [Penicillium macrosclerotiorum]
MKAATITTILAAAATTTFAAPSSLKRALEPLAILDLTGSEYSQTPPTTYVVSFALNDPNTSIDTDCNAAWSEGMSGYTKFNCSNTSYQVSFPSGISNIEDFILKVSRPDGSESGQNQVTGADWECKKTPNQYPEETCQWVGTFNIDVTTSS